MNNGYEGHQHIAKVMKDVVTDGEGVRISVYVSGCRFHCPDCFNASIWDFQKGRIYDDALEEEIMSLLDKSYISGLSILGGEPLQNLAITKPLIKAFRNKFKNTKTIWLWSGYMLEYIQNDAQLKPLLNDIDVLVDGPFVAHLKKLDLPFRGSLNQRIHYLKP